MILNLKPLIMDFPADEISSIHIYNIGDSELKMIVDC